MVQTVYTSARNVDVRSCDKPILLEKQNYFSEFRSELEKSRARRNLGIYEGDDLTWENIKGFVDLSETLVLYIKDTLKYSNSISEDISTVNNALDFVMSYILEHEKEYEALVSEIEPLNSRIDSLKTEMETLETELSNSLNQEINTMKESLNKEVESVKETLNQETTALKEELNTEVLNMKTSVDETLKEVDQKIAETEGVVDELKENLSDAVVYVTDLSDDTTSTSTVGGLSSGTTVASLKGKTISAILDEMLFPTTVRNLIQPTLRYSVSNQILEVGSAVLTPTLTFTLNDAGEILTKTETILYNSEVVTITSYDELGVYTHKGVVEYDNGEYLVDSKGNVTDKRIEAGSITTSFTVTTTYPWYAGNVTNVSKQSLVVFNKTSSTISLSLEGQAVIKLPGANSTISSFTVDGGLGYLSVDLNGWTKTTELINGIDYIVWTKNDSYTTSLPHQIKFILLL